jgi:hypothetical protein
VTVATGSRRFARSAGSAPDGAIPLRGFAPAAKGSSSPSLGDSFRRERPALRAGAIVSGESAIGRSCPETDGSSSISKPIG